MASSVQDSPSSTDMFQQLGSITRQLHDALTESLVLHCAAHRRGG